MAFVGPTGFPGGPMGKSRLPKPGHAGNMGLIPLGEKIPGEKATQF